MKKIMLLTSVMISTILYGSERPHPELPSFEILDVELDESFWDSANQLDHAITHDNRTTEKDEVMELSATDAPTPDTKSGDNQTFDVDSEDDLIVEFASHTDFTLQPSGRCMFNTQKIVKNPSESGACSSTNDDDSGDGIHLHIKLTKPNSTQSEHSNKRKREDCSATNTHDDLATAFNKKSIVSAYALHNVVGGTRMSDANRALLVKRLVEQNSNVNLTDPLNQFRTPLHAAINNPIPNHQTIRMLLNLKADLTIRAGGPHGMSPLDLTINTGCSDYSFMILDAAQESATIPQIQTNDLLK
jgi:hypothetical protein